MLDSIASVMVLNSAMIQDMGEVIKLSRRSEWMEWMAMMPVQTEKANCKRAEPHKILLPAAGNEFPNRQS